MNRKADNSVSFGKKLSYTRGSFYTLAINETNDVFYNKNFLTKIRTVLNYFRYSFHGDIYFKNQSKNFNLLKKFFVLNNLSIFIYLFS